MSKMGYLTCCVHLSQDEVPDLNAMVEAGRDVSFATFARHCDWQQFAIEHLYATGSERGLHLKDDWHVGYYRSTWRGAPCYYVKHSAIEHIFTRGR